MLCSGRNQTLDHKMVPGTRQWWPPVSVTRLPDYFSTFGHLQQWKFAQKYTKFAKVDSNFFQIVNKPSKNWQSGKIWPNRVTLPLFWFLPWNNLIVSHLDAVSPQKLDGPLALCVAALGLVVVDHAHEDRLGLASRGRHQQTGNDLEADLASLEKFG